MDEQINQDLESAASEELIDAIVDLVLSMEPTLEESHTALTWLLGDVMSQMQPDPAEMPKLMDFTVDAIRSAIEFQGEPASATIN